jgi:hypothetical protein
MHSGCVVVSGHAAARPTSPIQAYVIDRPEPDAEPAEILETELIDEVELGRKSANDVAITLADALEAPLRRGKQR